MVDSRNFLGYAVPPPTEGFPMVTLPLASRVQGLYVLGKNGTGKTTFIRFLIKQDLWGSRGLVLLDPHGDLIADILADGDGAPPLLLDLTDNRHRFSLNLFACSDPGNPIVVAQTVARVMGVFTRVWQIGPDTPRLARLLRHVTTTCVETGLTMAEVPALLMEKATRARIVSQVHNPETKRFWAFYESLNSRDQPAWIESTLNRIDAFLAYPQVRAIVGQEGTGVDWSKVIAQQQVVLVRLDADLVEPTAILGGVIVGQILDAALSRASLPPEQRHPFMLYADEYHWFATPAFGTLIDEARKYGIATTIAHQRRPQLDPASRGAPLGAVNIALFQLTPSDAEEMAGVFDVTPPPPEKVLKMVTEPVYEHWTETVWTPPEAQQQYETAQGRLAFAKTKLSVLTGCVGIDPRRWRERGSPDKPIATAFQPAESWLNGNYAYGRGFTEPTVVRTRPDERNPKREKSFGIGWDEWVLWRITPEWPSCIVDSLQHVALREPNSPKQRATERYLREVEPIVRRYRTSHQEYWCPPRRWGLASHLHFKDLEAEPCSEGIRWFRQELLLLEIEIADTEALLRRLLACKQSIPKRRYLYDRPVKEITTQTVNRAGVADIQVYRWEDAAPRAYADVKNEIANELTQLPLYHAKVRYRDDTGMAEAEIACVQMPRQQAVPLTPIRVGVPQEQAEAEIEKRQVALVPSRDSQSLTTARADSPPTFLDHPKPPPPSTDQPTVPRIPRQPPPPYKPRS